ncbi:MULTISPECIES: hypothetical protein [unclassified Nostoc]|uniref:hypothetical protein n=1 Tax=unclassified Nostoc TaxID=2593658 RepID=UPI002612B8C0|nr:hypothetical protein [Nostoc sp. S13]MDF5734274.1 hypothetical protein [Nostoc sp. S13]
MRFDLIRTYAKYLSNSDFSVPRQLLQLLEPPFGFTSRLRRETRLQRWIHRNALASLRLERFVIP